MSGLIVSNRYQLVCMTVPKCASTTMISVFADLHDQPGAPRERHRLQEITDPNHPMDRRQDITIFRRDRLEEAFAIFPDYVWFSIVRDPYGRLLSNYANKINRFAARFRRGLYMRYKLAQALGGPRVWDDVRLAMPYLISRISYRDFVETLEREGTDWDPHFKKQSAVLKLPRIRYRKLLRLESLQEELPRFLREAGVCTDRVARLGIVSRLNGSRSDAFGGTSQELELRPAVYRLYRADFEMLGYGA